MLSFASSAQSTLGAEWELAIVDAEDFALASRAPEVLEALKADGNENFQGKIVGEMLTNTLEIVSGVQAEVAGITADLSETLDYLRSILAPRGLDVLSAGTHPFSPWWEQEVTPAYRYEELVNRTQWWGRQMLIFGVHTHVGIANRDHVMPIVRALMAYVPHLEAVSASSPYWAGHDTQYASNRAMLFQQLPTAGLPFQLKNWGEYEDYIGDMLHTGVVDSINEIRWDIRPAPGWGTVEVRVCDGIPTLAELAAVTAFVQCLVHDMSQRLDRGEELNFLPDWFHRENKWRSARYGMDTIIIENAACDERLVTDVIADEVERLAPIAQELGCSAELESMLNFARVGASYQRQKKLFEETGRIEDVAGLLAAEMRAGKPAGW
ncbi:glutamate--cysteine ligase [Brevibacterium sp. HMSC063G07]|uniref:glutamate--cysteine ligase n=1 Tax=Brevibacterium sp. HMSC063G07 TaxID=1739261 RepID=UPI0008A63896|nr:glutamate--cysteine ligase [Brevibacterium sp. HMSC063G07]OFL68892.1 carboxylate--amine ligase [Brevibacterium sp. HMSC063G07]